MLPGMLNAGVMLEGGNLPQAIGPVPVSFSPSNQFVVPGNAQRLALRFHPASGAFSGSLIHPDGKRRAIRGAVVMQAPADGPGIIAGTFPGVDLPGQVTVLPVP